MSDLSKTIAPKSNQLNFDDFVTGKSITITVTDVKTSAGDQPASIHYEGDNGKPYMPCKSMRRVLVGLWGADGNTYRGRRLTLYGDPEVKFGGDKVGGIRISHMSDIPREIALPLTTTRGKRSPYTVKPLATESGTVSTISVAERKEEGEAAAKKGEESLKAWWKALGGTLQKDIGGAEYLEELKKIAGLQPTAIPATENPPAV
jgi:hypothetical protein